MPDVGVLATSDAVSEGDDQENDRNPAGQRSRRKATQQPEVDPAPSETVLGGTFGDRCCRREVHDVGHSRLGQLVQGFDRRPELRIGGGARLA